MMASESTDVPNDVLAAFLDELLIKNTMNDVAKKVDLPKIIESYQSKYDSQLLSIAMDKEGEVPIIPHHFLFLPPVESVLELNKHFREDYVKDVLSLEQSARQIDENSLDDIATITSSLPKKLQSLLSSFDDYIAKEVYQPLKIGDIPQITEVPQVALKTNPPINETKKKSVAIKKDIDSIVTIPPPPPTLASKKKKTPVVEKKVEPPPVTKVVKTVTRGIAKLNRSYVQPVQVLHAIIDKLVAFGIIFINVENKLITYDTMIKQQKIKIENTLHYHTHDEEPTSTTTTTRLLQNEENILPKSILPPTLLSYLTVDASKGEHDDNDDDKPSRAASMVAEDYMEEIRLKFDEFDLKWHQLGIAANDTLRKKWEVQSMLRTNLESLPKVIIDDVPISSDLIVNPFLGMTDGGSTFSSNGTWSWNWLQSLIPRSTSDRHPTTSTTDITTTSEDLSNNHNNCNGNGYPKSNNVNGHQDTVTLTNHINSVKREEKQKEDNRIMDISVSTASSSNGSGNGNPQFKEGSLPEVDVDLHVSDPKEVLVTTNEVSLAVTEQVDTDAALTTDVVIATEEAIIITAPEETKVAVEITEVAMTTNDPIATEVEEVLSEPLVSTKEGISTEEVATIEETIANEVVVKIEEPKVVVKIEEPKVVIAPTVKTEEATSSINLQTFIAESKSADVLPLDKRNDSFTYSEQQSLVTAPEYPLPETDVDVATKDTISDYTLNEGRKVNIYDGATTITESVSEQCNPTLPMDSENTNNIPDDSYHYCMDKMMGLLALGFHSILVDKVQTTIGDTGCPNHRHRAGMISEIIRNMILPKSIAISTTSNTTSGSKANIAGYRQPKSLVGKRKSYGDPWGPVLILCKLSELYLWEEALDTVFRDPSTKAVIQCTSYYGSEEDRAIIRQFWTIDGLYTARANSHIILTNYETFFEDYIKLCDIWWQAIVMDEPWGLLSNQKFSNLKSSLLAMNTRHRIVSCASLSTFPGTYLPDLKEALAVIFPVVLKVLAKEYQIENEELVEDIEEIDFKSTKLLKSLLASFTCVCDPRVSYEYKDSLFPIRGSLMDSLSWFEWNSVRLSSSSSLSTSREIISDSSNTLSFIKIEKEIKEEYQINESTTAGTIITTSHPTVPLKEFQYKFKCPEYTNTMGDWEIDFELRMLTLDKKGFYESSIRRPGRPKWKNMEQKDTNEDHSTVQTALPPAEAATATPPLPAKVRGRPGRKPKSWYEAQAVEKNATEKMELEDTLLPTMFRDAGNEEATDNVIADASASAVIVGEDGNGDKKTDISTSIPTTTTRMKRTPAPAHDTTTKRPRRECVSKDTDKYNTHDTTMTTSSATTATESTNCVTERGDRWVVEIPGKPSAVGGNKYRFLGTYATEEDAWKVYHASNISSDDLNNPALGSYKKGKSRLKLLPSVEEICDEDLASAIRVLSAPARATSATIGEWHSPLAIPTAHAKLLGDNFTAYIIGPKTMLGRAETNTIEFAATLGLTDMSGLACGSVDVHLSADRSIAEQHASIQWDYDLGLFYIKCITPLADIYVDGRAVTCDEDAVPLPHSTVIQIGCRIFYFLLSSGWTTRPNVLSPLLQRKYTWQSIGQTMTIRDMNSRLDETFDLIDEQRQLHQVIFKPPPFSVTSVGIGAGSGAGRDYSHQSSNSNDGYTDDAAQLEKLYDNAKDHFLLAAANNVKQQKQRSIYQQYHQKQQQNQQQRKRKKSPEEEELTSSTVDAKRRMNKAEDVIEIREEKIDPLNQSEGVNEDEEGKDEEIVVEVDGGEDGESDGDAVNEAVSDDDSSVEYVGENSIITQHTSSNNNIYSSSSSSSNPSEIVTLSQPNYDERNKNNDNDNKSIPETCLLTPPTDTLVLMTEIPETASAPWNSIPTTINKALDNNKETTSFQGNLHHITNSDNVNISEPELEPSESFNITTNTNANTNANTNTYTNTNITTTNTTPLSSPLSSPVLSSANINSYNNILSNSLQSIIPYHLPSHNNGTTTTSTILGSPGATGNLVTGRSPMSLYDTTSTAQHLIRLEQQKQMQQQQLIQLQQYNQQQQQQQQMQLLLQQQQQQQQQYHQQHNQYQYQILQQQYQQQHAWQQQQQQQQQRPHVTNSMSMEDLTRLQFQSPTTAPLSLPRTMLPITSPLASSSQSPLNSGYFHGQHPFPISTLPVPLQLPTPVLFTGTTPDYDSSFYLPDAKYSENCSNANTIIDVNVKEQGGEVGEGPIGNSPFSISTTTATAIFPSTSYINVVPVETDLSILTSSLSSAGEGGGGGNNDNINNRVE